MEGKISSMGIVFTETTEKTRILRSRKAPESIKNIFEENA
jgi:hypothetical protein